MAVLGLIVSKGYGRVDDKSLCVTTLYLVNSVCKSLLTEIASLTQVEFSWCRLVL